MSKQCDIVQNADEDFKMELWYDADAVNPTKLQLIKQYILDNLYDTMFEYYDYYKFTFDLKSKCFQIDGVNLIITCSYGGNEGDIYKFRPSEFSLGVYKPDFVTIHVIND